MPDLIASQVQTHRDNYSRAKQVVILALIAVIVLVSNAPEAVAAEGVWNITITVHEVEALEDGEGAGRGAADIYTRAFVSTNTGVLTFQCDKKPGHPHDQNLINADNVDSMPWACSFSLPKALGDEFTLRLEAREHDGRLNDDDRFDIHPGAGGDQVDLEMRFQPATHTLFVDDHPDPAWRAGKCRGRVEFTGNSSPANQARIVFSVSSGLAADGDSDGDGLEDSWEQCGVDTDGDGEPELDLPAMGADPMHKDLFVEVDWMADSGADHTHEPWLPGLINVWEELNFARVTNPDGENGFKLHVDVGDLYEGYSVDFDGDGDPEITPGLDLDGDGTNESIDLDGDGVADIGKLGDLAAVTAAGTPGGGNALAEDNVLMICGSGTELQTLRQNNLHSARTGTGVFYYVVFGHQYNASSNLSSGHACPTQGFIVTLGTWQTQRRRNLAFPLPAIQDTDSDAIQDVDLNGDGTSDPLPGPSGLPVHGTIGIQASTFLHEFGHVLGLGHGGDSGINRKPNYLSIMNYAFQTVRGGGIRYSFDGNLMADQLELDFDHDGVGDMRRLAFSRAACGTLNEGSLDERGDVCPGRTVPGALTRYGPVIGTFDWQWARVEDRQDWNRDGDLADRSVGSIAGTTAPVIPTDLNDDGKCVGPGGDGVLQTSPSGDDFPDGNIIRNGANFTCDTTANTSGTADDVQTRPVGRTEPALDGFDDYEQLEDTADAPVVSDTADITLAETQALEANTVDVAALPAESALADRCTAANLERISFESVPVGTVIDDEYAPGVRFLNDDVRDPVIAGPTDRDGLPTQSGSQSLLNQVTGPANTIPLVLGFDTPQRYAGLYLGRTSSGDADDVALLSAYDQDGNLIGSVSRPLPPAEEGITAFLGTGAVLPERPIATLVLSYREFEGGGPIENRHPVHVDELVTCGRQIEPEMPAFPAGPAFGDLLLTVDVRAEALSAGAEVDEEGHYFEAVSPLAGVPVQVDGVMRDTHFSVTREQASTITLEAPETVASAGSTLDFVYWRMDDHVTFPTATMEISTTLLSNSSFAAVYQVPEAACQIAVEATFEGQDTAPGDGACVSGQGPCTLRAAIQEANARPEACVITVPAGTYALGFSGGGEDAAATGDLDISDDLTLLGAGAGQTIVDGNGLDTVLEVLPDTKAALHGLTVRNGAGAGYPGGVNNGGNLLLSDCAVIGNSASQANAGGIWNGSTLTLRQCAVEDNEAALNGGGLYNTGTLTVSHSTIGGNRTLQFDGGGIASNGGTLLLARSTVADNAAGRNGGGIRQSGSLAIRNSTLSGNSAGNQGGGLFIETDGAADVNNATIVGNRTVQGAPGGGLLNDGGTATLANTILADNVAGSGADCAGTITSAGYNLLEDTGGCTVTGDTTGNVQGQDPLLGPLADNGGATMTHAPIEGSPAVDAANPSTPSGGPATCEPADQRGVGRALGKHCDIGAVEAVVPPTPLTLTINAVSATDAQLMWDDPGAACTASLYEGPTPAFTPGSPLDVGATSPYPLPGRLGDGNNSYYLLRVTCDGTVASSNRTGAFEFALTPGN